MAFVKPNWNYKQVLKIVFSFWLAIRKNADRRNFKRANTHFRHIQQSSFQLSKTDPAESNFAEVLPDLSHYEKILAIAVKTLEIQPENRAAWYNRGDALANLGCYEGALVSFNKAIELQPDEHTAWTFRAVVLIHLKRYQEALASCERALEIQPNDRQAWLFRGAALNHLGQYKQSYASYDKALGIQRESAGQKLMKKGSGEERRN